MEVTKRRGRWRCGVPRAAAATLVLVAFAALPAGAICTSTDLRLDREAGPMVAFAPQRPVQSGDRERAQALLRMIRTAIAPYSTLQRAAGLSAIPFEGQMKRWRTLPAGTLIAVGIPDSHDNEHRPRTLLYRRTASGIQLVGAQFEARNERTDAELDDILPTSVARWHQVVHHCTSPPGRPWLATVFPFARNDAAVWRTLEFTRYVTIAATRYSRRR